MESVYIETSVVSYLVARPNREPVTAWRQQLTSEWWVERRGLFVCVISQEVIAEALEGDADMAAKRMEALRDLPLIAGGSKSAQLAADLLEHGISPQCPRRRESSGGRDLRGSGLSVDVELPASGKCAGVAPAGEFFEQARPASAEGLHAGRTYGNIKS